MKKNFNVLKYLGFGLLVGIFFLGIASYYTFLINRQLQDGAQVFLTEVTQQSAIIVEGKIKEEQEKLNNVAKTIGLNNLQTQDEILALVAEEAKKLGFKTLGVALADGQLKTLDGTTTDIKDYPIYQKVMAGEVVISDRITWGEKNEKNNIYATPIKKNDQVIGALYGIVDTDQLAAFLDQETFQGKGYSHIVKANGDGVFYSTHQNSPQEAANLFEFWQDKELEEGDDLKAIQSKMAAGLSGYTRGTYTDLDRYIYYRPLAINDWYLVSVVPVSAVNEQAGVISRYSSLMINIGFAIINLLFLGILFTQRRSRRNLENIAYVDEVTGGHNWQKFKLEAKDLLQKDQADKYVMIFFDIDRFRFINEEYGHEVGDDLLKLVMAILKDNVGPGESYARVSNDHFVILCESYDEGKFNERIEHFIKELNKKKEAIHIRGKVVCQFGICQISSDDKDNLEKVREKANMARIEAKRTDNTIWFFYSDDFKEKIGKEKEIIDSMDDALRRREFEMYLQPKYNLTTKAYCGCEALVRWNRLAGIFLYPNDFIPVFEKNGFIAKLDAYMMEEAFKTMRKWQDAGHQEISMSVNVSRKNLNYCSFIPNTLALAKEYEINNELIEIELTESSIFEDIDRMIEVGSSLKKHGFKMSMDDFGSGYSSVNILAKLPLDTIKMDRGFFNDNFREEKGYVVVEAVIKLIKKLGLTVVAEGIEMEDEIALLKELKCDIVQGYYYGKPMPVADFEKLVFGGRIKDN